MSDAADGADLRSPVLPAITPSFYHHPTPFAVNGGFANQTKTVSKIKAIAAIRKISFAEIESDCWVISLLISLWCNDSRRPHSVIVNDVPTDPDKVRKKLLILEALANLLSGKPENEIVVKGKKKQATANP